LFLLFSWCGTANFIRKANIIHKKFYTYQDSDCRGSEIPLTITCPIHGNFSQKPVNHLRGSGCPVCGRDRTTWNLNDFLLTANKLHNKYYSYEKIIWRGAQEKIEIICPKHGSFYQKAYGHIYGAGCPKCHLSHGERVVEKYLSENHIIFSVQIKIPE